MTTATPPASLHLLDRIQHWAETRGDKLAVAFPSRGAPAVEMTWSQLHDRVEALASRLIATGVVPGDTVLVLTASPREQILCFLGVLRCGALPSVLSYPSIKQSEARFLHTFRPIAAACGARFLLGSREFEAVIGDDAKQIGFLPIGDLDALPRGPLPANLPRPERLFLQYSSGTTGLRKGIIISQTVFEAYLPGALQLSHDDCMASWLPLYHDMGLVGMFLLPMWAGVPAFHLSPFEWLKDPALLLQCIQKYKGTICYMPNFAYKFLAARITEADMEGVRLDTVRAFFNGGEVVRADTIRIFLHRFKQYGVRPNAMHASWGLAEALLALTQTPLDRPARIDRVDAEELLARRRAVPADSLTATVLEPVSSGRAGLGVELRIGGATEDRIVGEIEARSVALADGYNGASKWPDETMTPDGWFRTGDLGYLADGDLFVTGRKKDLIIHCGVNLHPVDLEEIVDDVPLIKPGRTVAFGVPDAESGTERVVIMAETRDATGVDQEQLVRIIREAVRAQMGVPVSDVALSKPGTLVKSTSGKLSRAANREAYLARAVQLPRIADTVADIVAGAIEADADVQAIVELWKSVLRGVTRIARDDDFIQLGGDSLGLANVAARIRTTFGVEVSLQTLFEARTPARQAAAIDAARAAGVAQPGPAADAVFAVAPIGAASVPNGSLEALLDDMARVGAQLVLEGGALGVRGVEGRLPETLAREIAAHGATLREALTSVGDGRFMPLAPFQERLLKAYANPNFNIAGALRMSGPLDPSRLESAFRALAERNDSLRMVFPKVRGRLFARVVAPPSVAFEHIDLSKLSTAEAELEIEAQGRRTRDDGVFRFDSGPLMVLKLFRLGAAEHCLLFVTNHATQDGLSFPYIFDDVATLYRGGVPASRRQYSDALLLEQHTYSSPIPEAKLQAWRERFAGLPAPFTLARPEASRQASGPRQGELLIRDIAPDVVTSLAKIAASESVSLASLLLGVFEASIARATGRDDIVHGVTALNRSPATEGAIGSFGKGNPCRFLLGGRSIRDIVFHVNERVLWLLDNDSPQLTRFLSESKVPPTLVNFNYISISSERLALDLPDIRCKGIEWFRRGSKGHPMLRDMAVFAVHRSDGGIRMNCSYDVAIHDLGVVEGFMDTYASMLHELLRDARGTLASTP